MHSPTILKFEKKNVRQEAAAWQNIRIYLDLYDHSSILCQQMVRYRINMMIATSVYHKNMKRKPYLILIGVIVNVYK